MRRALRYALDMGQPNYIARAMMREANVRYGMRGRLQPALRLVDRAMEHAGKTDDPGLPYMVAHTRGYAHLFAADYLNAIEQFEQAERAYTYVHPLGSIVDVTRLFKLTAMTGAGHFGGVVREVPELLDSARARADQFLEARILGHLSIRWLIGDAPDEARREIEESARAVRSRADVGVGLAFARTHVEPYERGSSPGTRRVDHTDLSIVWRLIASFLPLPHMELLSLDGRLALAHGDVRGASRAERFARKLKRLRLPFAEMKGDLLLAGASARRGNLDDAVSHLARCATAATGLRMPFHVAIANRRRGELIGGDEGSALIAAADTALRAEAVKSPERIVALYAPGFDPPR